MKQHEQNNWFHASEFLRAAIAIHNARGTLRYMECGPGHRCKYLELRVDQRTGDFIIKNSYDELLTAEEVYTMFPELKD